MIQRKAKAKKENTVFIDLSAVLSPKAIVGVLRNLKGRVIYNTGLIYFSDLGQMEELKTKLQEKQPELELHIVDTLGHNLPTEEDKHKGYWCPYCCTWNYWKSDTGGYKRCPICGISDGDYYVRKFNHLWANDMKNQKDKKHEDKMKNKSKKRREKENDISNHRNG